MKGTQRHAHGLWCQGAMTCLINPGRVRYTIFPMRSINGDRMVRSTSVSGAGDARKNPSRAPTGKIMDTT